ncbi:hypothetical protein PG_0655 [Porphyromonas gingivalis W83]|uniref:Uncharacterized protein n=1 Tax=Porphyromonas gingivalis (strain ATCC BAA-308 / W83) TaxID=242619 RepID=Q7MWG2_PORGI|nr:hypothetical protein PG_0655 [Porphyromonas gingivalis W83]
MRRFRKTTENREKSKNKKAVLGLSTTSTASY